MLERRKFQRLRTLKTGSVAFGFVPAIECTVRNLSGGGACLEFHRPHALPDDFLLTIKPECIQRSCRVAWKSAARVGVEFVSGN